MIRFGEFLKISTMSVALLSGTALIATVAVPDAAYAGKGNGNGNGNSSSGGESNAGGNGKSGDNAASKGKSVGKGSDGTRGKSVAARDPIRSLGNLLRGKSSDAKTARSGSDSTTKSRKTTVAKSSKSATSRAPKVASAPAPKPRGNPLARELGVHPSELGALNAAHASPNALANASPNSRVGLIAAYMGEVEESRELAVALAAAQADLASLDEPTRSQDEIDAAIDTATGEKAGLQSELDALNEALAETEAGDPDIEQQIADVTDAIAAKDDEIAALEQERADGEAYGAAEDEVARLEGELETQEADQRAALEDAANKPVTDEVETAVQKLLGIYEEPEETVEEDVTAALDEAVIVSE